MSWCKIQLDTVRKNYVDVEDLRSEVYYSIAVAKYTKHLGFTGVSMNLEHPKLNAFILLQFTTLNVNKVALIATAVVCMLIKLRHPIV